MKNNLLIITGCINPIKNQPYLVLKDKDERLKQYVESINYFIDNSNFDAIIFCENSNYKLDYQSIKQKVEILDKQFEYLTFDGDKAMVEERGKGYGEGEILEYVIKNSVLLEEYDYFYKITGRLKILNINKILKTSKDNGNFFSVNVLMNKFSDIDTRFYRCSKMMFKMTLMNEYLKVDRYTDIEHIYFQALNSDNIIYGCFKRYPQFAGISGGTGNDYGTESIIIRFMYNLCCVFSCFNKKNIVIVVRKFCRGIERLTKI